MSSFSKLSVTSPTSQLILILQPFRHFTYVTAHSPTHPSLYLQMLSLILQAFSHFTYVTAHSDSPTFPLLHLCHSSFSNPSLALPTSQLILQPFRCFTYVTAHSPTPFSPLLRHRIFTYVTWRAANVSWMTPAAICIRATRSCCVSTGVSNTRVFMYPQKWKTNGVRSGEQGGRLFGLHVQSICCQKVETQQEFVAAGVIHDM